MACLSLAFSALQHAPIHRRSKPNGAIEGPSKMILNSQMGVYSYFGQGAPAPHFAPPREAEATVKKIFLGTWIWVFLLKMVKMAVPAKFH